VADRSAAGSDWFGTGLRFECTQCGNCCSGPPGAVWFDEADGAAMARVLDLDEPTFYATFARRVNGRWTLLERQAMQGLDCVFLDRESAPGRALCRVYDARPPQCRTWPFWPENLRSVRSWTKAKKRTPCPGMDTGPLIPVEKIRILRDAPMP
jgi:Fe-S-cluster containining protein